MKIIVTGGAGFIGSNLIRHLLGGQQHQVLNIDKLCFPGSIHTISGFENAGNYEFLEKDISDSDGMHEIVREFAPHAIIHLAAESHVDRSIDSPETFIRSNIVGTFSLLEAFRHYYNNCPADQKNGLRFVHVSTDEVYGSLAQHDPAFRENRPYQPSSPYAASKAASDHLVSAWHVTYGLPLMITNCSNNYGPYQFPEKLIPLAINRALAGQTIPVYGKGENIRDWLHVDDHVQALCRVLEKGTPGETYNIGGNNEHTNLQVVYKICDTLDGLKLKTASFRDQIQFVDDRPGHDLRYAIDSSKIQSSLGWVANRDFGDGLLSTVLWYVDNREWCLNVCKGSYNGQRLGLG